MQEKAKVVAIDKDIVMVVPIDIDACIGCSNSECKSSGSIFTAVNSRKFNLKVGSEVRVGASAKKQLLQAFKALGLPVLFAVGAWMAIPPVFTGAGEGFQVAGALAALILVAAFNYAHSRLLAKNLPEVIEVL